MTLGFGRVLRHPLTGQVSWLAAAQFAGIGLSLLTTVVSARLMGPAAFGVAALALTYPSLLWSFVGVKSNAVTTRYLSALRTRGDARQLGAICKLGYGLDLAASGMALALVAATAGWVSTRFLGLPDVSRDSLLYAASLPFFSLSGTSGAVLASWGRFRTIAVLQVIDRTFTLLAVVVALGLGTGVHGYVCARALAQALAGLCMLAAASRLVTRVGGRGWWRASLAAIGSLRQELVALFGWNYVSVTLGGLVSQLPVLILGSVRGPIEAGYYRLGSNIVTVSSALEGALARVVYPVLSERWSTGERAAVMATVRRWTLQASLPLACVAGASIPFFPVLVPWVLGPRYASIVFGAQLMMVGATVTLTLFYANAFYYAVGRVAVWTKCYALYSLLVVAASWPVARAWGFLGVAVLTAGGEALFTLAMVLGIATWTDHASPAPVAVRRDTAVSGA